MFRSVSLRFLVIGTAVSISAANVGAENVEVAPFYGLRFGGNLKNTVTGDDVTVGTSGAAGATVDIRLPIPEKLELLYSHQSSDFSAGPGRGSVHVAIDEWQAGLLREYTMYEKFRWFLVGTLGLVHFSYENASDNDLFSVGLGGGFKYFPNPRIGFRLDARGYVSFVEGSGSVACSGGCVAHYQSSTFIQGEITPSVVVCF